MMSRHSVEPSGSRPQPGRAIVPAVIGAVALLLGLLIVFMVDDRSRSGALEAVPVGAPLTTHPTVVHSPPPAPRTPTRTPSSPPPTSPSATQTSPAISPTTTPPPVIPPDSPGGPGGETSSSNPDLPVSVLNNSQVGGLAEDVGEFLKSKNFHVSRIDSVKWGPGGPSSGRLIVPVTTVFYQEAHKSAAENLKEFLEPYDDNIRIKPNDGTEVPADGSLILVLTKHFDLH